MASTSTTGTDVWAGLQLDEALKPETTTQLTVINAAIRASHRWIKVRQYASGGTLTTGTFDYSMSSLSPAPYREIGINRVFIQAADTTSAPPEVHDVMQFFDASDDAWKLRFGPSQIGAYATKTFEVEYYSPHADVAALSTSIFLPHEFLEAYCRKWVLGTVSSEQIGDAAWGMLMQTATDDFRAAQLGFQTLNVKPFKYVRQVLP